MRIAFFSDVHGNLPALEAAWSFAAEHDVDRMYHLGDLAGLPSANEVIRFMFRNGILGVQGQSDFDIIRAATCAPRTWEEAFHARVLATLSPDSIAYLKLLPPRREIRLAACSITLSHLLPSQWRSATKNTEPCCHIHAATPGIPALFVSGCSHVPSIEQSGTRLMMNAGSVGAPADGDPRACVAMIEINGGCLIPSLHRVAYDGSGHERLMQSPFDCTVSGLSAAV